MEKVYIGQVEAMQLVLTNTPLLAAGAFVGPIFSVRGFTNINGFAFSDVSSAAGGLVIQQAADIADFGATAPFAITAGTRTRISIGGGNLSANAFSIDIVAPFARIIYTNGASPQATFRLWASARVSDW